MRSPACRPLGQQSQDSDPASIQDGVALTRKAWRFDPKAGYGRPNTHHKLVRTQVFMRQDRLDVGRGMATLRAVERRVRQTHDGARQPHLSEHFCTHHGDVEVRCGAGTLPVGRSIGRENDAVPVFVPQNRDEPAPEDLVFLGDPPPSRGPSFGPSSILGGQPHRTPEAVKGYLIRRSMGADQTDNGPDCISPMNSGTVSPSGCALSHPRFEEPPGVVGVTTHRNQRGDTSPLTPPPSTGSTGAPGRRARRGRRHRSARARARRDQSTHRPSSSASGTTVYE